MTTVLNPYIVFQDNAREAMQFYQGVFGGELTMNTFNEFQASHSPADDNRIMHAMLKSPNGLVLMGADTPTGVEQHKVSNISISLSGENEEELSGYYHRLAAGGTVVEPLVKSPWGDTFGMLKDKYGVEWMVNIAGGQPGG